MSEQHATLLKRARERLVEDRRAFAKIIAAPFEREKTVDARARFVELQATIEAIDRAIEGGPRVRLKLANYSFRRGISRTRLKAADREYPTRGPSIR